MTALLLAPAILSTLLLAAHALRLGWPLVAAGTAAAAAALAIRHRWVARPFQIGLALAAAEWSRTLLAIRAERIAAREPWIRTAVILAGVAVLAAAAAALFRTSRLRAFYRLDRS